MSTYWSFLRFKSTQAIRHIARPGTSFEVFGDEFSFSTGVKAEFWCLHLPGTQHISNLNGI